MITDTHAHLYWASFAPDLEAVLERAHAADVRRMIVVGTTAETSHGAFELCRARPGLFPTAGIHPRDTGLPTERRAEESQAVHEPIPRGESARRRL